ncbi:MAG: lamin tail domain-containing protein [Cyanobacteria bacterium J06627_28]
MVETTSILRGGIIFNEILADPNGVNFNFDTDGNGTFDNTDEFVELYNQTNAPIDISGLQLWDSGAGNWFTIPGGTTLAAKSYAYIVSGVNGGTLLTSNTDTLAFDAGRTNEVFNNPEDNVVLYDPNNDEYIQFVYNFDTEDDPTTYSGFSNTATRVGDVESWRHDVDGISLARQLFSDRNVIKQNLILDSSAGQPTATPGIANSNGTENNDIIVGTTRNNILSAGFGNDTVSGGDGNDELYGNADDDTLNGDNGADKLYGGLGNDTVNGGAGNDELFGQSGIDELNGGEGDDLLDGGSGNDTLNGDAGNDRILGQAGDDTLNGGGSAFGEVDTLFGGSGADTFILGVEDTVFYLSNPAGGGGDRGSNDRALIQDFNLAAGDIIQLSGAASNYYIETYASDTRSRLLLEQGEIDEVIATFANNIVAQGADLASGTGFSFVTAPPQTIDGTAAAETFTGAGGDDTISGNGGNDMISGAGGADRLFGGNGNDMLKGEGGDDRLVGQGGNDVLDGGGLGAGEKDVLLGNAGADTFVLGITGSVYYSSGAGSRGSLDRAIIQDFDFQEGDSIQLSGVAGDYKIETYSMGTRSRLLSTLGGTDEIIAIFSNNIEAQGADLATGEGFSFV